MAKDSQVNIRFDAATDADLEETARQMGVSKSALVRHLTATFLKQVKQSGTVPLNLKWTSVLNEADARSEWGARKLKPADPPPEKPPGPVKYPKK
jgi:antitoxin component of RelBE/YafQ-DinJ toxin-antitoxin module